MSLFYKVSYGLGFHPWEDLAAHPPFANQLLSLIAREEHGVEPPYGQALDLGCGSAVWGVQLAQRGWQVTGLDNVSKALERAKERIRGAGVEMALVLGDVTRLHESDIGSGYRLVLDTGTFHGLTREERLAMGREVNTVASNDATLLLDCFAPGRRAAAPRMHPRRRRRGVPRLGDHGCGHRRLRPRSPCPRTPVRRALLPA
jgi:SAM-dependent methyltransferase